MLGLRGNNVKLSFKPTPESPARKKNTVKPIMDSTGLDSTDSDSGVGLRCSGRRANSAGTTSRVYPVRNTRKLSEPAIKLKAMSEPAVPKRRFSTSSESAPASAPVVKQVSSQPLHKPTHSSTPIPELSPSKEDKVEIEFSPAPTPSTSADLDGSSSPEVPAIGIDDELSSYDQMLLQESDNLIQDVMVMCNEMGIDSECILEGGGVKVGKRVRIISPVSSGSGTSTEETEVVSELEVGLEVECGSSADRDSEPNVRGSQISTTTYDRIMSTLRHIEEDERYPRGAAMDNPTEVGIEGIVSTAHSQSDANPTRLEPTSTIVPMYLGMKACHISRCFEAELDRPQSVTLCTCGCSSPGPSPRGNINTGPSTEQSRDRSIYTLLDQVEKSDRDILFSLKFDGDTTVDQLRFDPTLPSSESPNTNPTFDSLLRKGPTALAKELLLLLRKYQDTLQTIHTLEDTLLQQRQLNMSNMRSAERDMQKRLQIQKEEFELALARHQTFVDQLIAEKRALQDGTEKALATARENEEKHAALIKSLNENHLKELKRLKQARETHRVKWAAEKEIQSNTVKNLAPEVQRLIARHQQELVEARAWQADELRAVEERYMRRQAVQVQEMREAVGRERELVCRKLDGEYAAKLEVERSRWMEEAKVQRGALTKEWESKERGWIEEKAAIEKANGETVCRIEARLAVELETVMEEHERKIQTVEARHIQELNDLNGIHAVEKTNLQKEACTLKEQALLEQETRLRQEFESVKARAVADASHLLREEFKRIRHEEEDANEARMKRLISKYKSEITDIELSESNLKKRISDLKSELLTLQDQNTTLHSTLSQKEKQVHDLNEANMKMMEERVNLTCMIRNDFVARIEELEEESRNVKAGLVELKMKHRVELEGKEAEIRKVLMEKEEEMGRVEERVREALERKEEMLEEMRRALQLGRVRERRLEELLEEQRKEFVGEVMGSSNHLGRGNIAGKGKRGRK